MDIRITNICNSDCMYCLEQSYRDKQPFIEKQDVFLSIQNSEKQDNIVTFYGGNPLIHTDLEEIILFCRNNNKKSIGILTNTYGLNEKRLHTLILSGLNSIGFYFNSFNELIHNLIVNGGINLKELLLNLEIIKRSGIFYKAIIHVNKQNIKTIYKDIYILNKKYGVKNFEFINYFPFDRPYNLFKNLLEYSYVENRIYIEKLFEIILKLDLNTNFVKFDKLFFGNNIIFYNFRKGVLEQIGEDDYIRLVQDTPFCFKERRCISCFIKDNCKFYE